MNYAPFTPLPPSAFLTIGSLTLMKPEEWNQYWESTLLERYPFHMPQRDERFENSSRWQENSCVLQSLEQFLLERYGVAVPGKNLFQVYNPSGEGVSPQQMLEAIAAVLEPLGFEIERVLVADAELAGGLGDVERTVGLDQADYFHKKPGICMINIRPGYSHAFYWKSMEQDKFYKEQFRMAVLIKRQDGISPAAVSILSSLEEYCRLLENYISQHFSDSGYPGVRSRLYSLHAYSARARNRRSAMFRHNIAARLDVLGGLLKAMQGEDASRKNNSEDSWVLEAGLWIRRLFMEVDDPAIASPAPEARSR